MVNPTRTTTVFIALMALSLLCNGPSFAQTIPGSTDLQLNTITTAVLFLMMPACVRLRLPAFAGQAVHFIGNHPPIDYLKYLLEFWRAL
jgi:hypothetical protein